MRRIAIFLTLGLVGVGISVSIALAQVAPTWLGAVGQIISLASACGQAIAVANKFCRRGTPEEPAG
jgi:hypothetical protein